MKIQLILLVSFSFCLQSFANCFDVLLIENKEIAKKVTQLSEVRQNKCGKINSEYRLRIFSLLDKGFQSEQVEITCDSGQQNLMDLTAFQKISSSTLEILEKLNLKCDHQIEMKESKVVSAWPYFIPIPDESVEKHLMSYFNERSTPGNLWMCENALTELNSESLDWKRAPKESCRLAHLILAGSRANLETKKCEYLIYQPKSNGEIAEYWLDREHLARNLRSLSWLENSK